MALTPEQLQTFRAALFAETDPVVVAALAEGSVGLVADWYNAPAQPDFIVTRSSVSRHEILTETSQEGTVFNWAGGGYITRAQGERDAFREMFNSTGTIDPRKLNIQAAIQDIFSGTGNAALNRAHIIAMSKRKALRIERLFATGTGTLASPGALVFEGKLHYSDVNAALAAGV